MIQRIQTIYLLLVTALLITSMCLPVGSFIGADAAMYTFKPLGVEQNGMFYSTWGVFGILLLSAIIAFATIFLFKNRMLQIRMSIFNSILLIGPPNTDNPKPQGRAIIIENLIAESILLFTISIMLVNIFFAIVNADY